MKEASGVKKKKIHSSVASNLVNSIPYLPYWKPLPPGMFPTGAEGELQGFNNGYGAGAK